MEKAVKKGAFKEGAERFKKIRSQKPEDVAILDILNPKENQPETPSNNKKIAAPKDAEL